MITSRPLIKHSKTRNKESFEGDQLSASASHISNRAFETLMSIVGFKIKGKVSLIMLYECLANDTIEFKYDNPPRTLDSLCYFFLKIS